MSLGHVGHCGTLGNGRTDLLAKGISNGRDIRSWEINSDKDIKKKFCTTDKKKKLNTSRKVNRLDEFVMNRLSIGHTNIVHTSV